MNADKSILSQPLSQDVWDVVAHFWHKQSVHDGGLSAARRVLPGQLLERAFCSCAELETLDAQHSEVPASAPARLRARCPHLRVFLHTPTPQPSPAPNSFCDSPEPSE